MNTLPLCALAALPALIQPALATSNIDSFEALVAEGIQTALSYAEIIDMIVDEKSTPAEAAQRITELTSNLRNIQTSMEALLGKLSDEEKALVKKALTDPELVGALKEIEQALAELQKQLIKAEYFKSPELKKACEAYMTVYSQ